MLREKIELVVSRSNCSTGKARLWPSGIVRYWDTAACCGISVRLLSRK